MPGDKGWTGTVKGRSPASSQGGRTRMTPGRASRLNTLRAVNPGGFLR